MKTVSGKVISTKSISLSKAAKVLSNFVLAETGSSQAISSYLRRTSAAFDELVQLHKELKASKKADDKKKKHVMEIANDDGQVKYEQNLEDEMGSDIVRKKHKKSKDVEREDRSSLVIEEGIRKKRKNRCVDREVQDAVEQRSSKKKKRIIESDR